MYRRHVGDVYRYALVVLRNPADAEDVTQTTFMNAYRAFQRGERPRTAQNWLISIAHNVCRQRFRQSARRPEEVGFSEEIGDGIVEEEQGPSAEDIQRALGHLAFNQRAALVMRELEGRSYAEIAEILGLSVSAIETLLFRARRALREQLEGSLTCGEAELAISKQMDGRLPRAERGALRAHLRECSECAHFARSQRAQRAAFKTLGALPLPASLASFFGGGGTAIGTGVALKAAAMLAAGAVVAGTSYEAVQHRSAAKASQASAAAVPVEAAAADNDFSGPAAVSSTDQKTNRAGTSVRKTGGQAKTKPEQARRARASANRGRRLGQTKAKHRSKTIRRGRSTAHSRGKHSSTRAQSHETTAKPEKAKNENVPAQGHDDAPAKKKPKQVVEPPELPVPEIPTPELPGVKKPK